MKVTISLLADTVKIEDGEDETVDVEVTMKLVDLYCLYRTTREQLIQIELGDK